MLTDLPIESEYHPYTNKTPEFFFKLVIKETTEYLRSAGYFSSGVLSLFRLEILDFIEKGGQIRLICSNHFTEEDYNILKNVKSEKLQEKEIETQIAKLMINSQAKEALSFFAHLVKSGKLILKIARPLNGGLFHDKTGCFQDSKNNMVTFRGSVNETFSGWSDHGNFETLETFRSWVDQDSERVNNHKQYLEDLWNNNRSELIVESLSETSLDLLKSKAHGEIDDFRATLENLDQTIGKITQKKRSLMPFQKETLTNWQANNFRGIIKHATGSGKTVTAIAAIDAHTAAGSPCIVVVPSALLLHQWKDEILKDIPDALVLLCGDGNDRWKEKQRLSNLLFSSDSSRGSIIIVIIDTMVSSQFEKKLKNISNILLVADEVHTIGSKKARRILNFDFGKRLGLSATPERHRDLEGTQLILNFFERILIPEISINDAIKRGRLVNYIYEPTSLSLDEIELESWNEMTKKLIQLGYGTKGKIESELEERIKLLLIKRSRIAKKASSKIPAAVSKILKKYQSGEFWLVYCEDTEQLDELNEILRDRGVSPYIYKSSMHKTKETELYEYSKNGGIMLSIRCLDEGVDIPKISHALIMASSQNPRQFIQRRGRVLRVDGVKEKAVIYDLFVVPSSTSNNIPDGLLRSELARASEFAKNALNHKAAIGKIRKMLIDLGLDPDLFDVQNDSISDFGNEED